MLINKFCNKRYSRQFSRVDTVEANKDLGYRQETISHLNFAIDLICDPSKYEEYVNSIFEGCKKDTEVDYLAKLFLPSTPRIECVDFQSTTIVIFVIGYLNYVFQDEEAKSLIYNQDAVLSKLAKYTDEEIAHKEQKDKEIQELFQKASQLCHSLDDVKSGKIKIETADDIIEKNSNNCGCRLMVIIYIIIILILSIYAILRSFGI